MRHLFACRHPRGQANKQSMLSTTQGAYSIAVRALTLQGAMLTLLVHDWLLDPDTRGFSMRPCMGFLLLSGTWNAPSGSTRTCTGNAYETLVHKLPHHR